MIKHSLPGLLSLGLLGGCVVIDQGSPHDPVQVSVQEMRAGTRGQQSYVSLDFLATTSGHAIACNEGHLQFSVGVSDAAEGPFEELPADSYQIRCSADTGADVALVVDNSGSEQGYLPWLQEAAHVMADAVFARDGRASLVRVSTDSGIELPLTDDEAEVRDGIDELFINNGWTALYDGIRMGNETLGSAAVATAPGEPSELCSPERKLAIVTFTDGGENNSANERLRSPQYPGDGIDTTFADLHGLQVDGVITPIYTVGLGDTVGHAELAELAEATGGRHHRVDDASDLPDVFQVISDYLASSVKVCTELPDDLCGDRFVRVEYAWSACTPGDESCDPADEVRGSYLQEIHVECPPTPAQGKVATILLTLSNPGIDRDVAQTLAANTVGWVGASASPQVLVVKDENHHGEFEHDAAYVHELLTAAGMAATLIDEPRGGLSLADTAGYDVIWLANPGHPVNDKHSLRTMTDFVAAGGGYVLQSDDATWFYGDNAFSMTPYTGLNHYNNGVWFCERMIDNNETGRSYQVMLDAETHPVIAGLEGTTLLYGNDIDKSEPANQGEEVLAWANGVESDGQVYCPKLVPVIVVKTPGALP
jgi:Mg-chelatase subunit ChlD